MTNRLYFQLLPLELKKGLLYYISPLEVYEKCHDLLFSFCEDENYWKIYVTDINRYNLLFRPQYLWSKHPNVKINYLSTIRAYPTLYWLKFFGKYYSGNIGFFDEPDLDIDENIYDVVGIDRYNKLYTLNLLTSIDIPSNLIRDDQEYDERF